MSIKSVICEPLKLLWHRAGRSRVPTIRAQIDEAWFSLRAGESVDGEEFFQSLERREKALDQKRMIHGARDVAKLL